MALHLKDIERMKDAGRNLADSKPDLQTDINRTNGKDKSSLFKKLKALMKGLIKRRQKNYKR